MIRFSRWATTIAFVRNLVVPARHATDRITTAVTIKDNRTFALKVFSVQVLCQSVGRR